MVLKGRDWIEVAEWRIEVRCGSSVVVIVEKKVDVVVATRQWP